MIMNPRVDANNIEFSAILTTSRKIRGSRFNDSMFETTFPVAKYGGELSALEISQSIGLAIPLPQRAEHLPGRIKRHLSESRSGDIMGPVERPQRVGRR